MNRLLESCKTGGLGHIQNIRKYNTHTAHEGSGASFITRAYLYLSPLIVLTVTMSCDLVLLLALFNLVGCTIFFKLSSSCHSFYVIRSVDILVSLNIPGSQKNWCNPYFSLLSTLHSPWLLRSIFIISNFILFNLYTTLLPFTKVHFLIHTLALILFYKFISKRFCEVQLSRSRFAFRSVAYSSFIFCVLLVPLFSSLFRTWRVCFF